MSNVRSKQVYRSNVPGRRNLVFVSCCSPHLHVKPGSQSYIYCRLAALLSCTVAERVGTKHVYTTSLFRRYVPYEHF